MAHDGSGSSLVPRKASVKIDNCRFGLFSRASLSVAMNSCSVLPIYRVDKKIRRLAPLILACSDSLAYNLRVLDGLE